MLYRLLVSLLLIAAASAAPSNDLCVNARPLTANEPVTGDNSGANFDFNAQGVCGARSDRWALWYKIAGTGRTVKVQVCTNNDYVTDYGVFNVCNGQDCQGYPPVVNNKIYSCAANEWLEYSFVAEESEFYYVHVRADVTGYGNGGTAQGSQFTIQYLEDPADPVISPAYDWSAAMDLSAFFALALSGVASLTWA